MSTILIPQNTFSYPRFGWRNILDTGTVTSTHSSEVLNLYGESRLYEKWTPTINQIHNVQVQFGSATVCDYVAFFSRDLTSNAIPVRFQSSNDGFAWTTVVDWFIPTNGAVMKSFAPVAALFYRIQFDMTSALASVNDIKLGEVTMVESGLPIGSTTPKKARKVTFETNVSNTSNFLGRSVQYVGWQMEARYELLSNSFIDEHWLPFIKHAEVAPFYWAWNYEDSPNEVEYCWVDKNEIPSPRTQTPIHWQVSLPLTGVLV